MADTIEVRLARLEGSYEQIDKRLAAIEGRLDSLETRMDQGFGRLETRMQTQLYWLIGLIVLGLIVPLELVF